MTMKQQQQTHLSVDDRIRIESLLHEGFSIRYIADRLGKAPSTVSRELKKHTTVMKPKQCDCLYSGNCTLHHVCASRGCRKKCKTCHKAKQYCGDYMQAECNTLLNHPAHLCNSCSKKGICHYERRIYDAKTADKEYRDTLVNSRNGFDLTAGQLRHIDEIISPLVKKGQSVYHIMQNNKEELSVSESTIRRLISASELEVRSIDLPEAVKRKPRRKPQTHPEPPASKTGHLYTDYLSYTQQHDIPTVQMDCVEGKKTDSAVILTLHFVIFHMQLSFILKEHSAACVVEMLDRIEYSLGKDLFAACFPLILTDNGHEFTDIKGMERSVFSGKRTKVFFCDPNRSDEKGGCENNHKLIRNIIPKGSSIQHFTQADMTLLTNHINSYSRKSLFGKCPYALAMNALPEDFFVLLGLEKVPAKEVALTPKLLKRP